MKKQMKDLLNRRRHVITATAAPNAPEVQNQLMTELHEIDRQISEQAQNDLDADQRKYKRN
jgi:hypothetical protein